MLIAMERLELRLKAGFIVLLVVLGVMSCGLTPLIIWLVSIKDYPRLLDAAGVTLRNGKQVSWRELTRRQKVVVQRGSLRYVSGIVLNFGKTTVKIAPRVLVEGNRVLPYISQVLGEDLTRP